MKQPHARNKNDKTSCKRSDIKESYTSSKGFSGANRCQAITKKSKRRGEAKQCKNPATADRS